jgi:hypothetical protein
LLGTERKRKGKKEKEKRRRIKIRIEEIIGLMWAKAEGTLRFNKNIIQCIKSSPSFCLIKQK